MPAKKERGGKVEQNNCYAGEFDIQNAKIEGLVKSEKAVNKVNKKLEKHENTRIKTET